MKINSILFLFVVSIFFGHPASADSNRQAISDGTTMVVLKNALARELAVTNIEITSYAKDWNSYNPMSWVIDPDRKYRVLEFSFVDRNGQKQKMSCSLNILRGQTNVTVHSCTGAKAMGSYTRLAPYGLEGDQSIIVDGVVSKETNSGTNGSGTTR